MLGLGHFHAKTVDLFARPPNVIEAGGHQLRRIPFPSSEDPIPLGCQRGAACMQTRRGWRFSGQSALHLG